MNKGHILPIHAGGTIALVATKGGFSPRLSCADLFGRPDRAPASVDPKDLIVLISGMSGQREELIRVLSRWGNDQQASVIAQSHSSTNSIRTSAAKLSKARDGPSC